MAAATKDYPKKIAFDSNEIRKNNNEIGEKMANIIEKVEENISKNDD